MSNPQPKPRRRVEFELHASADSWADLADALRNLAFEVDAGHCRKVAISGSPSCGYHLTASEDESVTHDSYMTAVREWLRVQHAPQPADRVTPNQQSVPPTGAPAPEEP